MKALFRHPLFVVCVMLFLCVAVLSVAGLEREAHFVLILQMAVSAEIFIEQLRGRK